MFKKLNPRHWSLSQKLMTAFLLLSLGPISLMGHLAYRNIGTTLRQHAQAFVHAELEPSLTAFWSPATKLELALAQAGANPHVSELFAAADGPALAELIDRWYPLHPTVDLWLAANPAGEILAQRGLGAAAGASTADWLPVQQLLKGGRPVIGLERLDTAALAARAPALGERLSLASRHHPDALVQWIAIPVWGASGDLLGFWLGGILVNGNDALVDGIFGARDFAATVYLDQVRVATTLGREGGGRLIGSLGNPAAAGGYYESDASGQQYAGYSAPLIGLDGEQVGNLAIGMPLARLLAPEQVLLERLALIITLVSLVAVAFGLFFTRLGVGPFKALNRAMRRVSTGDLSGPPMQPLGNDEFAEMVDSFNAMRAGLYTLVGQVERVTGALTRTAAHVAQVAAGSEQAINEIARNVSRVAEGARSQAQSAERGRLVLGQLADTAASLARGADTQASQVSLAADEAEAAALAAGRVAQAAQELHAVAAATDREAVSGGRAVEAFMSGVTHTSEAVLAWVERVQQLERHLGDLDEILAQVERIAHQSGQLVVSAALAAAGNQGASGAQLLEELQGLADFSAHMVQEIAGQVATLQIGAAQVLQAMQRGTARVEAGARQAQVAEAALDGILDQVHETYRQASQITGAAGQITHSAAIVASSLRQLSRAAEATSAASQQLAAGTGEVERLVAETSRLAQGHETLTAEVFEAIHAAADSTAELAAFADELNTLARDLGQAVQRFKL